MKRLLSILLSVMLILGSVSITVFAAPELSLVTTNTLAGMSSAAFADTGKYVLFNAVEGATYKNNGVAATVITNPLNKADYVALKVDNVGVNIFTAEVNGVTSNEVGVYGIQTTSGSVVYVDRATTAVVVDDITDETLKATLSERDNIVYYAGTSGSTFKTIAADDTATYRLKSSVYINQDALNGYVGLPRTSNYHAIRPDLSIYLNSSSGSTKGGYNTGFAAATYAWNDFEFVINKYESNGAIVGKLDAYYNNILIGKGVGDYSGSWSMITHQVNETDRSGNVYHTKTAYSADTIVYNPALTIVADEENDTVTVTGIEVSEFADYTAKVFVNGVATVDEVTVNAEGEAEPVVTTVSVPTSVENATVYVAYVDAEGDILSALTPLKSNEVIFESIPASDVAVPLILSLNTSACRVISGTLSAEAGKKVLFNEITLEAHQSGVVKYFHNGVEVADVTSPVAGTIAMPVVKGENAYTAKRIDAAGVAIDGTESAPVYVNGLDMPAKKERGYYANNADRFTAQTSEEIPELYGRTDVVKVGTHSWLTGKASYDLAANAFTEEGGENEYVKYSLDAYYNLVDGKINGSTGAYGIMAAGTANSEAAYKHFVLITDDGSVGLGLETNYVDSGMDVAPGQWNSFELCINKSTKKFDLYVNDYLVITNWRRSGTAYTNHNYGVYWYNGRASTGADVYLSGDYRDYYVYGYNVAGDLTTGAVEIPAQALEGVVANGEKVSILGLKKDGTINATSFTYEGADVETTLAGAPYSKMFVWVLNKLLPVGVIK